MLRLIRMEEIRFLFSLEILSLMMKLTLMILSHLHWLFNVMRLLLLDTILVQSLVSRIHMSRYIQNQTSKTCNLMKQAVWIFCFKLNSFITALNTFNPIRQKYRWWYLRGDFIVKSFNGNHWDSQAINRRKKKKSLFIENNFSTMGNIMFTLNKNKGL